MKVVGETLFKTALWKEQWPVPLVEHSIHGLLSTKLNKNEIFKQLALTTKETYWARFSQIAVLTTLRK